jgi:hypothetical protein
MSSVADHKAIISHSQTRRTPTDAPQRQSFSRLLKSAVVMNWTDFISEGQSGVVHVDCCFGDEQELNRLRIWVATEPGEWRLAGEYSTPRLKKSPMGMNFEGGFRSEKLARTLDTLFEHQHSFAPLPNPGRDGLIEVEQPTSRGKRMAEGVIASMLRSLRDG